MTDYDQGYEAAIKALKDKMNNSGQDGASGTNSNNVDSQGNPQAAPELNPDDKKQSQSTGGRGSGKQGVVQPEDCDGSAFNDQPNTPGTYMDRKKGKDIAESEGYEDNQGGDDNTSKEWKDVVNKNIGKLPGDKGGKFAAKLAAIWNTTTNWIKALKDIVGRSLNTDDRRQAFANKNVLVSQNRIARTDKDKYDLTDYMVAFIDSSGSMEDRQLQIVLGEIYNIAVKKKPVKFAVVQCDTRIQEIKIYSKPSEIKNDFKTATVKGRGGTELSPCWKLLKEDRRFSKQRAELCVVFTDGYLTQYKRDPKTMNNLLWVILDNPSFKLQYPEIKTKVLYLNTADVK